MSFILSLSLSTTLYDSLHMMIDDGDENGDDDDCSIAVFVVLSLVQQNITKIYQIALNNDAINVIQGSRYLGAKVQSRKHFFNEGISINRGGWR